MQTTLLIVKTNISSLTTFLMNLFLYSMNWTLTSAGQPPSMWFNVLTDQLSNMSQCVVCCYIVPASLRQYLRQNGKQKYDAPLLHRVLSLKCFYKGCPLILFPVPVDFTIFALKFLIWQNINIIEGLWTDQQFQVMLDWSLFNCLMSLLRLF